MARIQIKKEVTWPCTRALIDFLTATRETASAPLLRAAINHAIIFYSACFIEGVLEAGLKALLRRRREVYNRVEMPELEVRKTTNTLFNALEEDVDQRISRATGIDAYDDLFRLVTGSQLSRRDSLKPIWEGMCVLFQFRNVLAHGREISAARLSAYWIKEPWLDQFTGGYKRAEEYLVKRKLISKGFWDSDSEHLFFSDDVADHFWCLSSDFVREVQASVDAEDRAVFAEVLLNGASSPDDMAAEQSPAGDVLKAAPEE